MAVDLNDEPLNNGPRIWHGRQAYFNALRSRIEGCVAEKKWTQAAAVISEAQDNAFPYRDDAESAGNFCIGALGHVAFYGECGFSVAKTPQGWKFRFYVTEPKTKEQVWIP